MVYCFEYLVVVHLDSPFNETQVGVVYNFLSCISRYSFYEA